MSTIIRLFGDISILILAVTVLNQGIGEFRKAKGKALLIVGTMLLVCFFITLIPSETPLVYDPRTCTPHGWGCFFAFILIVILGFIFDIRWITSKKFIPSGLMLIFCCIENMILISMIDYYGLPMLEYIICTLFGLPNPHR